MEGFARSQYRLLGKLKRHTLKKSKLSDESKFDIYYLGDKGCLRYEIVYEDENIDFPKEVDTIIHIMPQGKAVYDTYIRERRRWLVPVVISIFALIISIIALCRSSQSIKIYLNDKECVTTQYEGQSVL